MSQAQYRVELEKYPCLFNADVDHRKWQELGHKVNQWEFNEVTDARKTALWNMQGFLNFKLEHKLTDAITCFRKVLEIDKINLQAHVSLVFINFERYRDAEAFRNLEDMQNILESERCEKAWAVSQFELGFAHSRLGPNGYKTAKMYLEGALTANPYNVEVLLELTLVLSRLLVLNLQTRKTEETRTQIMEEGQELLDQLTAHLKMLLCIAPRNVEVYARILQVFTCLQLNRSEEDQGQLQFQLSNHEPLWYFEEAKKYFQGIQTEKYVYYHAIRYCKYRPSNSNLSKILSEALDKYPADPLITFEDVNQKLRRIRLKYEYETIPENTEDLDEVQDCISRLRKFENAANLGVLSQLAEAYSFLGQSDESDEYFSKLFNRPPVTEYSKTMCKWCCALFRVGEVESCLDKMSEALNASMSEEGYPAEVTLENYFNNPKDPRYLDKQLCYGYLCLKTRRYNKAEECFKTYIRFKKDFLGHFALAKNALAQGFLYNTEDSLCKAESFATSQYHRDQIEQARDQINLQCTGQVEQGPTTCYAIDNTEDESEAMEATGGNDENEDSKLTTPTCNSTTEEVNEIIYIRKAMVAMPENEEVQSTTPTCYSTNENENEATTATGGNDENEDSKLTTPRCNSTTEEENEIIYIRKPMVAMPENEEVQLTTPTCYSTTEKCVTISKSEIEKLKAIIKTLTHSVDTLSAQTVSSSDPQNPKQDAFNTVSRMIRDNQWKEVCRELQIAEPDYLEAKLDDIEANNSSVKDRMLDGLWEWEKRDHGTATVEALANALEKCKLLGIRDKLQDRFTYEYGKKKVWINWNT